MYIKNLIYLFFYFFHPYIVYNQYSRIDDLDLKMLETDYETLNEYIDDSWVSIKNYANNLQSKIKAIFEILNKELK